MAIERWECDNCGCVWAPDVPPAPLKCPRCGSTNKIANKPGGLKPINWPGSVGG